MGQLPYEILGVICSYCVGASLTQISLCDTLLCHIARPNLYYHLDFPDLQTSPNPRLSKITSAALHHLRLTRHLSLCGGIHNKNIDNLVELLVQLIQNCRLRSCTLRFPSNMYSPVLSSALSKLLNIGTLQRLRINIAHHRHYLQLVTQALSIPSLRDITIDFDAFGKDLLDQVPSVPRPLLDTIHVKCLPFSRYTPTQQQSNKVINISQIRRVCLEIHIWNDEPAIESEENITDFVPFLKDLPAANVEGFAVEFYRYDDPYYPFNLEKLKKKKSPRCNIWIGSTISKHFLCIWTFGT